MHKQIEAIAEVGPDRSQEGLGDATVDGRRDQTRHDIDAVVRTNTNENQTDEQKKAAEKIKADAEARAKEAAEKANAQKPKEDHHEESKVRHNGAEKDGPVHSKDEPFKGARRTVIGAAAGLTPPGSLRPRYIL